jgi:hypothetical protein
VKAIRLMLWDEAERRMVSFKDVRRAGVVRG